MELASRANRPHPSKPETAGPRRDEAPIPLEPLQHVAYLHDGSLEGLLCCIFESYVRHEQPEDICEERSYQPRFEQSAIFVQADFERALRVRRGIEREAGSRAFGAVARAAAADKPDAGMVVFRFVRYVMDSGPSRNRSHRVLNDLANPIVADLVAYERRTSNEAEKMRQFIRFSHLENGVWFARCNPSANVVPLVMNHFAARFNVQPFVIYDEKHRIAGVFDGNEWNLVAADTVTVAARTEGDAAIERLWQRFYDALTIESRYNPELRRQFMPVRLWRNLPEVAPRAKQGLVPMQPAEDEF